MIGSYLQNVYIFEVKFLQKMETVSYLILGCLIWTLVSKSFCFAMNSNYLVILLFSKKEGDPLRLGISGDLEVDRDLLLDLDLDLDLVLDRLLDL